VNRDELCGELRKGAGGLPDASRARLAALTQVIHETPGSITWPELLGCCSKEPRPNARQYSEATTSNTPTLFDQFDLDKNGSIDLEEFAIGLHKSQSPPSNNAMSVSAPHLTGHAASMLRGIQSELSEAKRIAAGKGFTPRRNNHLAPRAAASPGRTPRSRTSLTPRRGGQLTPRATGSRIPARYPSVDVASAESMVDDAIRRERDLKENSHFETEAMLQDEIDTANRTLRDLENECENFQSQLEQAEDALADATKKAEQVPNLQNKLINEHTMLQVAQRDLDSLQSALAESTAAKEGKESDLKKCEEKLEDSLQKLKKKEREKEVEQRQREANDMAVERQLADSNKDKQLAVAEGEKEKARADAAERSLINLKEQAAKDKILSQEKLTLTLALTLTLTLTLTL